MPVQGGFIVLKPSMDDYSKLIHILMNTEFAQGGGWNRSKIGWFWGGMTVQGVLPYYYNTRGDISYYYLNTLTIQSDNIFFLLLF
jgi:hypothetical protein